MDSQQFSAVFFGGLTRCPPHLSGQQSEALRTLRFSGVISRYLPNYLGWLYGRDGDRISTPASFLRASLRMNAKSFREG